MGIAVDQLRPMIAAAVGLEAEYLNNIDEAQEQDLLDRLEDAEEALTSLGSPATVPAYLLGRLDAVLNEVAKASGDVHKDEPYKIGRAKREEAARLALAIRGILSVPAEIPAQRA